MSNPHVQDSAYWEAALDHYHWDRLDAAYEHIQRRGIGEAGSFIRWYRVIEAESVTRQKSRIERINHWLTLEYVADEVLDLREQLARRTLDACDDIARRLGWTHSVETMVSILAEETDAPWATNPYGYCVSKEPYEKICLPCYLIDDADEFVQAISHEYAHVISDNLSDGHAPRWLEEAVSVLAERSFDRETWKAFCEGKIPWHSPDELELLFDLHSSDEQKEKIWHAYQQCGWIGRYLARLSGEGRLADLLRDHCNESVIRNLKLSLSGKDRVDGAVEAIYRMSLGELFERTYQWVRHYDDSALDPV